jgi:copper resistance protein K
MKRIVLATSVALLAFGLSGNAFAQRHDEKPHGMVKQEPASTVSIAPAEGDQAIVLKDGGTLILHKDGTTYHANAAGKRVRMRDGAVMEGKDGERYMMKNDAVWKQITEKGTMHPNHP